MRGAIGTKQAPDGSSPIGFAGRSFVLANDDDREAQRVLEREIEARGGTVHPFLTAMTDVLVVGRVEGNGSAAHWAREQVRRGEQYRVRWGHLEIVSEDSLRAAIRAVPAASG